MNPARGFTMFRIFALTLLLVFVCTVKSGTTHQCVDIAPSCANRLPDKCKGEFRSSALINCKKTCNLCGATGSESTNSARSGVIARASLSLWALGLLTILI